MQTALPTWPLPVTALKPALELALAIEHAPMGVLVLTSEKADRYEPVIAEGLADDQLSEFSSGRLADGLFDTAISEHRRVTIPDVFAEGHSEQLRELARMLGFRAIDVVPLMPENGRVVGALAALFRRPRIPTARCGKMVEGCGTLFAIALDNARLRGEAERRRQLTEDLAHARVAYIARLGHELRTPLQSITGYMELLRLDHPGSLSQRQHEMLERVQESAKILINAIGDLGTMARLEAGRLDYLITAVPASRAIATAVAVVSPLAQLKHVELDSQGGDHLLVMADEMKLKQILVNLLANAVKFTPEGGRVCIGSKPERQSVRFDVSDNGPGIPEGKIEAVFQPFVQLASLSGPPSPVSNIAGSGLGLAISHEFAEGMNGRLTAASIPGNGSVFTLRLPKA